MCVYVRCVGKQRRDTAVAELFMMPDRDAVSRQRCLRGKRLGFTHRHSCLSFSFFPPSAFHLRLLFSTSLHPPAHSSTFTSL